MLTDNILSALTDGKNTVEGQTKDISLIFAGQIIATTSFSEDMTPAWIVYAWAPVLWQAASAPKFQLIHLGTRVLTFGNEDEPSSGQTLWGDHTDDQAAGVAWDWVELRRGVVAMSDPLGMVTNLRLIGADGEPLEPSQIAVQLHRLVHALPWQSEVARILQETPIAGPRQ